MQRCLAAAWLVVSAGLCLAAPYTPTQDQEVVAHLPRRLAAGPNEGAPGLRRPPGLHGALRRNPHQLGLALLVARQAIDRARSEGDPRELGQAQAALGPWWPLAAPPAPVRLLRAIVLQAGHAFDASQSDLDALLAHPELLPPALQAQALLTRASLMQVRGRYDLAGQDCARLAALEASLGQAAGLPARACAAELAGLQGRVRLAQKQLQQLAVQAPPAYAGWLALMRAELAERCGDAGAQALYRQALAAQADVYTQAAWADWLLDHGRASEVTTLLAGREETDALLLRLAIAYRAVGDRRAAAAAATLRARLDDAAARGDNSHGREQARFALAVEGQASVALRWATQNWTVQKEPADARLLVDAALAAAQPQAAEPVRRFMRETGYTDVRLRWGPA